jgi:CHAD domain-containing protein
MASKPSPVICNYGADVIQEYLNSFRKEIAGVQRSKDLEYIHRMRVASRRLARAIAIFESCYPAKRVRLWKKDMRQVTRVLGLARDRDIQAACVKRYLQTTTKHLERPGVRRLLLRVIQKRQDAQWRLLENLDKLEKNQTLESIDKRSRVLRTDKDKPLIPDSVNLMKFTRQAIGSVMDKFLSFDAFVERVEAVKELHAMRIAAKKLRYTMECFAGLYPNSLSEYLSVLRRIQDHLGNIHDCDIWQATSVEFIDKERHRTVQYFGTDRVMKRLLPGLEAFFEDRRRERVEYYASFVVYWKELGKIQIWEKLRKEIDVTTGLIPPLSG